MSLRLKVLLILSLIFFVGGFWGYRTIYNNIRPQYLRVMEDGMVGQTFLLAKQVEFALPERDPEKALKYLHIRKIMKQVNQAKVSARIYEWVRQQFDFRIYITNHKGIVQLDTDHDKAVGKDYSRWNDVYRSLRGRYGARSSREFNSHGQIVNALYTSFPIRKNGQIIGSLTLVKPKASITGWATRAQEKLWKGLLVGATVLFILASFLTQMALNPITRLTQYAKDIAAGRRMTPPEVGNDEIGQLTQAFIEMKDSLWKRMDIERFVTQLTHELKSPICAIQGASELLEDPMMPSEKRLYFLKNITEQSQRMDDIVQRLLHLVSLEQQEYLENKQEIQVQSFLDDLQRRFAAQAEKQCIDLDIFSTSDCPTHFVGEPFLLKQALTNLLQNSFHFTPQNEDIDLCLSLGWSPKEGDARKPILIFTVNDTGSGVPDYAAERVMEKFYSLEHPDTGKKGTGLGLPFVHQVALLHGGDFLLKNREENGVCAEIWIPIEL